MKVGIGRAAAELGVSRDTLRRWEAAGRLEVERTPSGHRRYDLAKLRGLIPPKTASERITVVYARVSGEDKKKELKQQVSILETFCVDRGWEFEVIQDLGTGMNYYKRGLRRLIQRLCEGGVGRLVITHRDRLARFGVDLVFAICENFGTEIVVINPYSESTFEEELAEDVMEIVALFSARLYGSHNHKNKDIIERLREIAGELQE